MKVVVLLLSLVCTLIASSPFAMAEASKDWVTGLPREAIHVKAWPGGKKVAVCFIFYVEHFGFSEGPNLRPDMVSRKPDVVDEGFRQYAIEWGVPRVARIFKEHGAPMSIALNALFPTNHREQWKQVQTLAPNAPIIAHGINNTTRILPLEGRVEDQQEYIETTLKMIAADTGVKSIGWSSPSVYANADTFSASTAAGIKYSLDAMDSDVLSRLNTKSGPLVLIPYPPMPVDMGQYLQRLKNANEIGRMWVDYVSELAREAEQRPDGDATIVAIGVHPFVFGTPDGGLALCQVLDQLKQQKLVWLTDTQAVMEAIGAH